MSNRHLQIWIVERLDQAGGRASGMPRRDGVTEDEMIAALLALQTDNCIRVIGPPSQNSDLAKDVDEIHLLPNGVRLARRSMR